MTTRYAVSGLWIILNLWIVLGVLFVMTSVAVSHRVLQAYWSV